MKIKDLYENKKQPQPIVKPRNFVAKNAPATTSGAGSHRDKKREAKRGQQKHKNKDINEGIRGGFKTSLTALEFRSFLRSVIRDIASEFSAAASNTTSSRPSAPDTSKFSSTVSHMISHVANLVHKGGMYGFTKTFIEFLKLGAGIPPAVQNKIHAELEDDLSQVVSGLKLSDGTSIHTADGYKFVFNRVSGSSWGGMGFYLQKAVASEATIKETATAGATSSANIGTVVSPHIAIGKDRGSKSYTGSPGKSGTKAPAVPKVSQPKNKDGTAKNALDSNVNIFGGSIKR